MPELGRALLAAPTCADCTFANLSIASKKVRVCQLQLFRLASNVCYTSAEVEGALKSA